MAAYEQADATMSRSSAASLRQPVPDQLRLTAIADEEAGVDRRVTPRRGRAPRPTSLRATPPAAPAAVGREQWHRADGHAPAQLLLTVEEAAARLHIGRRQAFELVWRGELPVVRLGPRTIRVASPVLEQFVLARSRPYGA